MNTSIYDINYKKLVTWMVPQVLRKTRLMVLINALISPVAFVYSNLFLINRRSNLYKLLISPQVCYVEMALNDKYDPGSRQIKIDRAKTYDPLYLYQKIEQKPLYLFKKSNATADQKQVLYQKNEASSYQYDFIVKVPATVVFDQNEMMAVIDNYILPDKVYKISIV